MTIAKRILTLVCAFALCAAIALGSLSFMPKASAVNDYEFPFSESDIPSLDAPYHFSYACYNPNSDRYLFYVFYSYGSFSVSWNGSGFTVNSTSNYYRLTWSSSSGEWSSYSYSSSSTFTPRELGSPFPYSSSVSLSGSPSTSFTYSFHSEPLSSIPKYWDYMPFFFPELPYGYFDGHINSVDGSYTLDLGQVQGTTTLNNVTSSGSSVDGGSVLTDDGYLGFWAQPDSSGVLRGYVNTDQGEQLRSAISTTGTYTGTVSGSGSTSFSGTGSVAYVPSFNETSRFRTWAVVSGSSYCYFVCDTRNTISGSLESVNDDKGKLRFSAVGADGVHYPFYCIEFAYDGTKIQTLSALPNGFTVDFVGGTLEQDQDTGIWSCDPLYHGFWLSDGCPPVVLSSLTDESYKWLANPVFGEEAFTLNFLNAINENIAGLRSDLSSLQSAMQSSISNQTSAFQNMDAPSAAQPSTSQMMDYFSKESAFHAPNTDDVFSGDIKSGHYWEGVTWWSSKFNDIIVSNDVIVAFTTAMLTLGLAVMIIGRRFSMR